MIGAGAAIAVASLAACTSPNSAEGGDGKTIALLLPESKTTRYESFDRPIFTKTVKKECPDCTVKYYNADQDEAKQAQQMETALSAGAKVVVLDPVNGPGAGGMVSSAHEAGAQVVAYDRFIKSADYYMSFDNETVGKLQATELVKAMGNEGGYLQLNGSPSDPNAAQFKKGAESVLKKSGLELLTDTSYDNPDWSPNNAQKYVTDQLSKFNPDQVDGVYAANDGQAGGVIAALKGAGVAPDDLPPVTGQDAELAAIQRIVAGEQEMTVFKSYFIEAAEAAELAVNLINGKDIGKTTDFEGVKSFIFKPVVVNQDNVQETIVESGLYSADDICTKAYADACEKAGVS